MLRRQEQDVPLGALQQYRSEVKWIPQVTDEEERQLLQCIACRQAAQQARTRLIEGYQPLVLGIAKRYERYCREMELLDLVQEGNLGLLQALENYDENKSGSSFGTWAYSWIRGMIRCALLREGTIRLPLRKARAIRQMGVVNTRLFSLLGREPTIEETAREMRVTPREVRELIVLQEQQVVSLHASLDEDEDLSLEEVIADPVSSAFTDDGFSTVGDVFECLTEDERAVLLLRCGSGDRRART